MILLAGDFLQPLPVIPKSTATPADEINAYLKSSNLWINVKILGLTTNVCVQLRNGPSADESSKQLLDIGNGKMPIDRLTGSMTIPANFCSIVHFKEDFIQNVFPNITQQHLNYDWLSERAILAAKNKDVDNLNSSIQHGIKRELITYK